MNFYNISQGASRLQTAQHFHSSLEEPTLDNVEAQLQVARQRNYQLSLSYFQNKYGSGEAYDQYVASHGLEGLGPPPQQQFDLTRELEKQAEAIRQREMRKIQQKKQGRPAEEEGEEEEEGQVGSRLGGRKSKARANPWEGGGGKAEKPAAVEREAVQVEEQFYEVEVGREREGAFLSEFKNYLANKRKPKPVQVQQGETGSPSPQKTLSQSFNVSQLKNASSLSQKKAGAPKYQQELVRKMVRDIAGRCEPSTRIEKVQLIEYLTANPKIPRVLGVAEQEVARTVLGLASKDANLLSFSETLAWVLGAVGKGEEARRLRAAEEFEQVPQGCMLGRDLLGLFEETFRSMDRHGDLLVKRAPFLARLTADPLVRRALNLPAVFEPEYDRHVSLRRVLERLEIEGLLCSEEERRANEFMSWSQFIGHFQSGHRSRAKYDLIVLLESLRSEDKFGLAHLPESVFEIVNWGVRQADKGEELLSTAEVVDEIKLHRDYEIEKFTFLRSGEEGGSDTFEDVLVRIKEQALRFVTPKEFLEYFSVRGKPIEQFEKERVQQQAKNLSAVKVTFVEDQLFPNAAPDGYDSDPETYNHSALHHLPDPRSSQKEFKRFKATTQSFPEPPPPPPPADTSDLASKQFKLTVPQPFSFEEREKQRRARQAKREESAGKQEQMFRAGAVPASVAEVGLFERMQEEQRRKNEERKKCSMIMTLANERPFSFEGRKANKKNREEREQFIFRAKPIPWFCSVDLLRKKQEEEVLRNERIAKLAQENLAKAKLPPRMEKDYLQKEARKTQQQYIKRPASSQPRAKQPPDFDRLHRQFEEALERKRKQNKTTEVCEFNFSTNCPRESLKGKSQINPPSPEEPTRKGELPQQKSSIDIFAQSTAKFTQQVEQRRKEAQEKRREEERRRKEEEARGRVDEELKQKVQEAARKNRESKEVQAEKRRGENAKAEHQFQEWKKERVEKGRQQPLLIDRVSKRDEKIEKMKRLYDISQTLIGNGIRGKEHDHYFKREELLLLQDYKDLKGKL